MGDNWPKVAGVIISVVPALMTLLGALLVFTGWPWRLEAIRFGTWMVIGGAVLFLFEITVIYYNK